MATFVRLVILVTALAAPLLSASVDDIEEKVCIGTTGRMSVPSNREHHYRNLRDRYTNCTYVDGNLELTWLQDEHLDLSFLQHIREVTGHVLISHVDVKKIVLPRLQIIRGRTLFKLNVYKQEFALLVTLSKMHSLELPALRDILSGSVGLFNNYNLCFVKTINWEEILTGPDAEHIYVYNFQTPERECPRCDPSCKAGCWGEGPDNCQKFSKINCSPQCYQGRCFGTNPRECCHLFCAGGCTGPKQDDCLACRNFYDDGVCTQECPAMQRYNPTTYSWETNPAGKYAYGATCVKKCPQHLLKDNGACVRSCPERKENRDGECVPCTGPCPKTCENPDTIIHSGNIDSFKDCTIIQGSITILDNSFKGYQHFYPNYTSGEKHGAMDPAKLEVLSTVKEVTGFINIQGDFPGFHNLSFLRNLEVIRGRQLTEYFASLYIVKTSLTSLGLRSLKKIQSGSIAILENKNLCFVQGINWKNIKMSGEHHTLLQNNKPEEECLAEKLTCDKECSKEGCWGPGPTQCLNCTKYQLGDTCLSDCDAVAGMYKAGPKVCGKCHPECESTCTGPGPGNCTACKHARDGPFCVPKCPDTKYSDLGQCKPCHANCVQGCDGPQNTIGPLGCHSCHKAIIGNDSVIERCLKKNEPCPDGYFEEYVIPKEQGVLKPLAGKATCRKCHPRCRKCTGYGFHEQVCQVCAHYKRGEQCEEECPQDHYADNTTQVCVPCSDQCRGCIGPSSSDCLECRNFRIPSDIINSTTVNCSETCPDEYPHKVFPPTGHPFCTAESKQLTEGEAPLVLLSLVLIAIIFLVIAVVMFMCNRRFRAKAKDNVVKMLVLQGMDEPLRPTNVKPNLAKLRIVKEAELRKGGVLGYGAFGTVYKGVWVPEGEQVKIPVAIKVLRERMGANTTKEFLDEAYIMATVEHPHLLQLQAVCMTSEMMLVTHLMPLGCVLDYVKNNRDRIGSKLFLNWCTQIAKGMAYLEEKRLVHRDLAARNVLLKNPNCVKITDFGLAKLLDINEDEYKAAGGKMPIKWLAPECIQHRVFTHKSDIWAFGVTIWELLTYGGRPYESVPARDVPDLLEKGERLPQPHICTIDVYMLMVKCWMLEPDHRPGFKELADELAKMARDPGRYLVIPGDQFMRLPSYSSQHDDKDGVGQAQLSGEGEATEDYLQPSPQSPSPSPPHGPFTPWAVTLQAPNRRYCTDPLANKDCDTLDVKGKVQDLKLVMQVDEDDYLMPSPLQSQPNSTYMDLIGDTKITGEDGKLRNFRPDFLPPVGGAVDNPEYHLMGGPSPPNTAGLPPLPPQRSSEEESDHEYYNDFDRLRRELQPLRRNETTV